MLTTILCAGLAVCVLGLVIGWARVRDLEDMLAEAERSLSERVHNAEKEVMELAGALDPLKEKLETVKASMEEIHSDMKEHDDDFEKFLTNMSNVMNYSVEVALNDKRPEDDD